MCVWARHADSRTAQPIVDDLHADGRSPRAGARHLNTRCAHVPRPLPLATTPAQRRGRPQRSYRRRGPNHSSSLQRQFCTRPCLRPASVMAQEARVSVVGMVQELAPGMWHTRHSFGSFVMCGGVAGLGGAVAWPGVDLWQTKHPWSSKLSSGQVARVAVPVERGRPRCRCGSCGFVFWWHTKHESVVWHTRQRSRVDRAIVACPRRRQKFVWFGASRPGDTCRGSSAVAERAVLGQRSGSRSLPASAVLALPAQLVRLRRAVLRISLWQVSHWFFCGASRCGRRRTGPCRGRSTSTGRSTRRPRHGTPRTSCRGQDVGAVREDHFRIDRLLGVQSPCLPSAS